MLAKGPTDNTPSGVTTLPPRDEIFSILDENGRVKKGAKAPEVSDEDCKKLYRGLLQVRIVDDRMMKLQRQGRLGFLHAVLG